MSTVWYVRHGESESNVKRVFAGGQDNTPLTALGKAQAIAAGKFLKSHNAAVNFVVCSPLGRAHETARLMCSEILFDSARIKIDPRLEEYDVPAVNGLPYEGMNSKQLMSFKGAENPDAFAARIRAALLDINKLNGTVLVVAHGGVGKLIECLKSNGRPNEFYDYPKLPNAQPFLLDLDWLHSQTI